jgi:DNA-binding response OmpR family regulator
LELEPACSAESDAPIEILSISAVRDDHKVFRELLEDMACRIGVADTCHSAYRRLNQNRVSIIICARDLPDGTWRNVLNFLGRSSYKPLLIVTSKLVDESFWAEVLNLGGFDVIAKPFLPREVRHVVKTAFLRAHEAVHLMHSTGR